MKRDEIGMLYLDFHGEENSHWISVFVSVATQFHSHRTAEVTPP